MWMLIDWNNDKIFIENVDFFGPSPNAFVAFFRGTQIDIVLWKKKLRIYNLWNAKLNKQYLPIGWSLFLERGGRVVNRL